MIRIALELSSWLILAMSGAGLALLSLSTPIANCHLKALADDDTVPLDFCSRLESQMTNNDASAHDLAGVRIVVNTEGLIDQGFMDPRGWDLAPRTSGNLDVQMTANNLDDSSAVIWLHPPSFPASSTITVNTFMGNAEAKRDQGIRLTGSDTMTAASHADFDLTDDISITVRAYVDDDTAQTGPLLERHSGTIGYGLGLADSAGNLVLRGEADTSDCDVAWDPSWSGATVDFGMTFVAPNLELFADGVSIGSCNTALPSVGTASTALTIGDSLDGVNVTNARLVDTSGTAVLVALWDFNPGEMEETSAVDPTYQGTVQDLGPNDHDLTYTFTRSQANFSFVVGSVRLAFAPSGVVLDDDLQDVTPPPFSTDLFTSTENQNVPGYHQLDAFCDGTELPRQACMFGVLSFFGVFFALPVGWKSPAELAVIAFFLPMLAGSLPVVGLLEPWIVVLMGMAVAGMWGWERQAKR